MSSATSAPGCCSRTTGSGREDYLEAEVIPGMTVFVRRGGVETARNVGTEPYREIIIELKD